MKKLGSLIALVALHLLSPRNSAAGIGLHGMLERVNRCIHGRVVDHTYNHGRDCRIWSNALCEKRDLYVYLPPGFDPCTQYPLGIFLHGATQDEQFFLETVVQLFDEAIVAGRMPPCILAAPDGSMKGRPSYFRIATFFANTRAGCYEDWLMQDVWDFLHRNYPIQRGREAHALMGVSMGGSAAVAQAIKHKDRVKMAIGIMPAVNLRWVDCHGHYRTPFDPCCWGWRDKVKSFEVIGRLGPFETLRFHNLVGPLIGHGPDAMPRLASFNPIEMIDHYGLKDGDLDLFIGYGGQDEFNIAAQAESFLYRAKERGITVEVSYDPRGRHDVEGGKRLMPAAIRWAAPRIPLPLSPLRK
jgi:S-formylglutathione hydrolase FrmB